MTNQKNNLDVTSGIDVSKLKLGVDSPYCTTTGDEMVFDARSETWKCPNGGKESLLKSHWDLVLLHAASANKLLEMEGIEVVLYCGVPIDREDAVSPSHLLPLLVQATINRVQSVGLPTSFMLGCTEIEATETANSLTDLMVRTVQPSSSPAESLNVFNSVVLGAIASCRQENHGTNTLEAEHLLSPGLVIAAPEETVATLTATGEH